MDLPLLSQFLEHLSGSENLVCFWVKLHLFSPSTFWFLEKIMKIDCISRTDLITEGNFTLVPSLKICVKYWAYLFENQVDFELQKSNLEKYSILQLTWSNFELSI